MDQKKKSQIDRHCSSDRANNEGFNRSKTNNTLPTNYESLKNEFEKLKNELKNIQDENELLLMQLHLAQEELEMYYLANQEMISVIKNSRKFMNTIRRLLTNGAGKAS